MLSLGKKIVLANLVLFNFLASANHQKQGVQIRDPPCFFNPLCVCSKSYPDLGRVTCKDVPLMNVPEQIRRSKVFMLHLEKNGLRYLEPNFFSKTGLFKIEITWNLLREISKDSFAGLDRSLTDLNLAHNKLRKVPNQSLRHLRKLKFLDLSDNEITSIRPEDWLGLEDSLKSLILSGNKLSGLRPKAFSILRQLELLDLSKNSLLELDGFVFKGSSMLLNELNLSGNLFSEIPVNQISELRELRHLDMSFNLITEMQELGHDRNKGRSLNLLLDTLRLDYNQIQYLPAESFKHFSVLNRTYLTGNPIAYLEKDAFQRSKIREVYMGDCEISELAADAFSGLESHLEILNMDGNNLTKVPPYFFKQFKRLKSLSLKNNFIEEFDFDRMFDGHHYSLQTLDVSDQLVPNVNFQNWDRLRLHSLAVSKFPGSSLSSNDLQEFFQQLEEFKISHSNIKNLKSHAFKHVRGLRRLDLSENSISSIENKAFSEVMHSLQYLSLGNGLSSSLSQLPSDVFENLTALEFLDLSNNGLRNIPQKLFHAMKRLKIILLQDNFIEFIPERAFQSDLHPHLNIVQLSYNQLSIIQSHSFADLENLEALWLNDNRITRIDKKAFTNLNQLRHLYLRGNKINSLGDESFEDLPELEKLDLAYNRLKAFNYNCLEQVGTLSSFALNVSFNQIEQLIANASVSDRVNFMPENVNIKELDLSHNNISFLEPKVFRPIESSVTHLYLSHNKLQNLTKSTFENMMHLQWLDISYNSLANIEDDAFANTNSVQVLDLSHNRLQQIPKSLFAGFRNLRVIDLSHNELRTLEENAFRDSILEKVDLSNNHLSKVPIYSFDVNSGETLSELDLSENLIVTLPPPEAFVKFKNLHWLNLSKNRIIRIEDGTFSYLHRLEMLDLSHNGDVTLDSKGRTFYGLSGSLQNLFLKNLSLNAMPSLPLISLETLDLSLNNISTIPFEFSHNLTNLRRLEMADNKILSIPLTVNAFTKLEYLGISGNPLESINIQQSFSVRELDLRNISLDVLEKGALGKVPFLEKLKLTVNETTQNLNLPYLVRENYGLNHLHVEVFERIEGFSLTDRLIGWFPAKLKNLTIVGQGFKVVPRNLLEGIRSPVFTLVLFNTSVEEIAEDVFSNARRIRNLSLDFRSNKLQTMFNPNTGNRPNVPKKVFLVDLQIFDNNWQCDCAIGWIEGWQRKRRQFLCEDNLEECLLDSDNMRSAVCSNRDRKAINEVFKSELECGWNSSGNLKASFILEFLILNVFFNIYHVNRIFF